MRYEYDVDKLWTGASYGNQETYARTSAKSNLHGLWSAVDDQHYCGKWHVVFYLEGERLESKRTLYAPAYQTTFYTGGDVAVSKSFFLPYGDGFKRAAYFVIRAHNLSSKPRQLGIVCDIEFPEFAWPDYVKTADIGQKRKRIKSEVVDGRLIGRTEGREEEVRIVGATADLRTHLLSNRGANLAYSMVIEPGKQREDVLVMVIGSEDEQELIRQFEASLDYRAVFERTCRSMDETLGRSDLMTPDPVINRSVKWAKVNVIREQKLYPAGWGFTNDPPQDVLVVRDAAWCTLGSDYVTRDASRGTLELIGDWGIEDGGKITEYILCCEKPPFRYDYGLNINDDTPLYIIAVYHHFALTRDRSFLDRIYSTIRGAASHILTQKSDGLIRCHSEESNAWGIGGWRNIIPEYQINGASTELNSECCLALRLAACLAKTAGDTDSASLFAAESDALRAAINTKLVSEKTGLYILNESSSGYRHELLSGDMIFPVITGVADGEMEKRVLDRLAMPDFRTDFGTRTVPKGQSDYDPEFGVRLMGGIWPNLTAWVGYGNRKLYPERTTDAMHSIYRICEPPTPRDYKNVVPGQFPECLHGETFQSRGMALSPWVAPTYLWLAMEGVMGIEPTPEGALRVAPHLPADWKWAAIRRLPFAAKMLSFFVYDGRLYSTADVTTDYPQVTMDQDVSDHIACNAYAVALMDSERVLIFAASDTRRRVKLEVPSGLTAGEQCIEFDLGPCEGRLIEIPRTAGSRRAEAGTP